MEKLREIWYIYLMGAVIVGIIVKVSKIWISNYVSQEVNKLDESVDGRIEKTKQMFGRFADKSQSQYDKISDELSELKGSFGMFFKMWMKKNGK